MNTTTEWHVIGIGAATLDDMWLVSSFQGSEGVQQALDHVTMGGGPVATALAVLACLGRKVALMDVCGDDLPGTKILEELTGHGVHTGWIQRVPATRSTQAVVHVRGSDGARQITFLPCSAGEPAMSDAFVQGLRSTRLLHLNGRHENLAREAVRVMKEAGGLISWDGGAGRYKDSIRDLVEASHLRIVSREFAECYTGMTDRAAMMHGLLTPPARLIVITEGAQGSYGWTGAGEIVHQPCHEVSKVVDTTGCGDVYHGGFLHGWLAGWDLPRCMGFASDLAARNAAGLGGRFVCRSAL
ncbi:MAG: PfkB family carbohydrate kinase [Verrucomicrobiota bacterium]